MYKNECRIVCRSRGVLAERFGHARCPPQVVCFLQTLTERVCLRAHDASAQHSLLAHANTTWTCLLARKWRFAAYALRGDGRQFSRAGPDF